jgi:hypothetical protein
MHSRKKKYHLIRYLPVYGCLSTGIIYVAIGVIAILSFLGTKQGGADENSLLVFLNKSVAGKIFIWIILLGTICYIIWRIYESIKDPYDYGNKWKGLLLRTGIALSTIPDALIAYSATLVILGKSNSLATGQPAEERQMAGNLLQQNWGEPLIIAAGFIMAVVAIVQLIYGITSGYKERLDIGLSKSRQKKFIQLLAWVGYFARATIVGIIGVSFIKAGITQNAQIVVNTDKAFDFIGDHIGHLPFIIIAIGTICYGFFMFALGFAYDIDKD